MVKTLLLKLGNGLTSVPKKPYHHIRSTQSPRAFRVNLCLSFNLLPDSQKPNGLSNHYKLDGPISNLKDAWCFLLHNSNFNRILVKVVHSLCLLHYTQVHVRLNFIMEANTINPGHNWEQSNLGQYCFKEKLRT